MQYDLDLVLNHYSPGCRYRTVSDVTKPDFNNIWFRDYVTGTNSAPEPTEAELLTIAQTLADDGAFTTSLEGVQAHFLFSQTSLYGKILVNGLTSLMLLAYFDIILALLVRSTESLDNAKASWQRLLDAIFDAGFATTSDYNEFNSLVDSNSYPVWLKETRV